MLIYLFDVYSAKVTDALGRYLSTNERYYSFVESPKEGLVLRLREMMDHKKDWSTLEKPQDSASGGKTTYQKQYELLSKEHVYNLLVNLISVGEHFFARSSFTLNRFWEDMMSAHGGVSLYTRYSSSKSDILILKDSSLCVGAMHQEIVDMFLYVDYRYSARQEVHYEGRSQGDREMLRHNEGAAARDRGYYYRPHGRLRSTFRRCTEHVAGRDTIRDRRRYHLARSTR